MTETHGQILGQAIDRLSQADPLIKLLQEVKLGRMKPTDAGLRAITESWLDTYREVLEATQHVDQTSLRRLDPSPRVNVLISAGVLTSDHPAVQSLLVTFEQTMIRQANA
jgi:hypothetical protein